MPRKKLDIPGDAPIAEDWFVNVTNPEQRRFLAAFVNGGYTVYTACQNTGIIYSTARAWHDEHFLDALAEAKAICRDKLERELWRRAYDGVDVLPGVAKKHDNDLLKFLLKKLDPEFRDKTTQDINLTVDVTDRLRLGRERARMAFVAGKPQPQIPTETTTVASDGDR